MDINVNTPTAAEHAHPEEKSETPLGTSTEQIARHAANNESDLQTLLFPTPTSFACQPDSHAAVEKLQGNVQTKNDTVSTSSLTATNEMEQPFTNEKTAIMTSTANMEFTFPTSDKSHVATEEEAEEDEDGVEESEGAEYDITTGSTITDNGCDEVSAVSMLQNMNHHSFDDIQFFPASHHRSLRLQPQFQFHQDQLNDPNFHLGPNLSCFDASDLVNLSGSGSVSSSFSLISDSTNGDISSAFSESPFVFPDNVMEYGEPQFFPGNCVGYLETILEEDDEEYEEEEGCSGRHWWTANSDSDTDSVIRVDNHGQTQQQKSQLAARAGHAHASGNNNSVGSIPGEKDEVRPHFRSSASSKPFELEDLHLFDQLDNAFEETLREPKRRSALAFCHPSQSVESSKALGEKNQTASPLKSDGNMGVPAGAAAILKEGERCQKSVTGAASNDNESKPGADHHHVFIESGNNDCKHEMTTKELKMLTQENVKAHSRESSAKIIYEVGGEEREQNSKKLGNAESRETFGSSLSPSSSDSEAPAEVAEEDFFYSSPGSEEEECRSQEETESEASCSSSDDSKGVVLAEFSLGPHAGNVSGGFNPSSSGGIFGSGTRSRRSFDSPSRLKSFRSFDSLNCLAGTELLFSKPDTFPSIHHIKEVSEPSSESESSNEVSAADDRGLIIPEEDEEEEEVEQNNKIEGSQSLPSQHLNTPVAAGFPGPALNPGLGSSSSKNSTANSSTSTVSSNASASGLRSTENLSEDSGIGNDGISNTAASTPGAFLEESNVIMSNSGKQNEDSSSSKANSPSAPISAPSPSALLASPATSGQEVDTSLLLDSAKEYITRAEFALNPFVYSSLSSSEPESSISSAASLGCNKMSISKDESLQVQQQLQATGRTRDMPNNVANLPDQAATTTTTTATNKITVQNSSHEFVLDCHSNSSSSEADAAVTVQNYNLSCKEGNNTSNASDEMFIRTQSESSTKNSQLDSNFNLDHDSTPCRGSTETADRFHSELKCSPPPPTSSPVPTILNPQPALPPACKSNDNYLNQMTLDGSQDKRELANNSSNPSHEGQPIIINGSGGSPVATFPSSLSAASQSSSKSVENDAQASVRNSSVADKLAGTSLSTLSAHLPETTAVEHATNGFKRNARSFATATTTPATVSNNMLVKQRDLNTNDGIPLIHEQDHSHQQKHNNNYDDNNMTSTTMMDGDIGKKTSTSSETGGVIISSSSSETTKSSCTASPRQSQLQTTIINENERNGKDVSSISSSLSSATSSPTTTFQVGEEREQDRKRGKRVEYYANETNSFQTQTPSSVGAKGLLAGVLSMSSVDDAEGEIREEEKHASLKLSSSLLPCAADKSFSTCSLTQDDHHHQNQKHSSSSSYSSSSSSSGDEQNENISSEQPKFRRQRSDSESEYEAAESAVERNNVDMAYDIIVNSPSKKQALATAALPISRVSGVVGATTEMTTPTIETTTSSFSAMSSSSLAHVQPVVVQETSYKSLTSSSAAAANNPSALTPAQYHSQSQSEMNANKFDNMKSGPVSTLNGSLINIHRNDMHNVNSESALQPDAACKGENINKYNTRTTTRNYEDKKLPVFESCLDDYDDDDDDAIPDNDNVSTITSAHVVPPGMAMITENMQTNKATNNTSPNPTNNIFISVSSYTHKTVCSNSHHEAGQRRNVTHTTTSALAVNGKQVQHSTAKHQASSSSLPAPSVPLEKQQPHRHEIENTSLLLHHQQLHQQRHSNNQREQYENSDELTTTASSQVAQSHFPPFAASSNNNGGIIGGFGAHNNSSSSREQHKGLIVTAAAGVTGVGEPLTGGATNIKNKNFSGHVEAQQQQKHDRHQRNALGSVTLDDSTSADVTHKNNLQLNHREHVTFSSSHPATLAGVVALKASSAPKQNENYSKVLTLNPHISTSDSPYQIANNNRSARNSNNHSQSSYLDNEIDPRSSELEEQQQRQRSVECSNNTKGYHHPSETSDGGGSNKVVIAEPYYPNEIGVAEVKKFLAGYIAPKECVSFSGPVEPPPPSHSVAEKESSTLLENNNKQRKTEPAEYYHSQSVKNLEKSASTGGPTTTVPSQQELHTGGRERVILGDSNFGYFGCSSSHSPSLTSSSNGNIINTAAGTTVESAILSHKSVVPTVLPQVNLDLHTAKESSFSSGYGFPCSSYSSTRDPNIAHSQKQQLNTWHDKEQEQHHQQQLRLPLKENNTFCPSSIDASSSSSSISTSIKRSVSPSSSSFGFSLSHHKAAQESSKDLGKAGAVVVATPPPPPLRRDQPQHPTNTGKDIRQQQKQKHLHLEDISLYAAIDKFSVPLGAIKAAVVAVAPTIPSYIVGPGSAYNNEVEKNASKLQNSNDPLAQTAGSNSSLSVAPTEANGNLSKVFPKGTITTSPCAKNNSPLGISSSVCGSSTLPKGGENNDTHEAIVPDILILKQFPCMPASTTTATSPATGNGEKIARGSGGASVKDVMEFDITPASHIINRDGSNSGMSGNGRNITTNKNKKEQDSSSISRSNIDSISSVEMLRSDSPAGSSAPSGLPLKTKTYGPRNEVEVVVVSSSRTPSPAPGGFVSTLSSSSSSSSSQKLPSVASPALKSVDQQWNEPAFSRSTALRHYDDEGIVVSANNYHYSSGGGGGGGAVAGASLRESSIPPPPSSPSPTPASGKATRSRVHFSPVVSEISWRESYIDQSSECSGSTEDLLAKLEDSNGNPVFQSGKSAIVENNGGNNHCASANLRKAGAVAAAGVVGASDSILAHSSGDNCDGVGKSDGGSSVVRPLQVYDIQMSTRAESPSSLIPTTRGQIPSGKGPILVEKVEMRSSPLHDHDEHEEETNRHMDRPLVLGESQSARKLMLLDDEYGNVGGEEDVDNDPERVTDLVDFRHNGGNNKGSRDGGDTSNSSSNDQNNGTLGLYEDVEVQIEPTAEKSPCSTTLSMVPDLLSQCENTNSTLTHIDVKIEDTVPGIHTKNIVLNICPPSSSNNTSRDIMHSQRQQQPQKTVQKSQSPQPQDVVSTTSPEPRQIFPKMFAEENKNDNKRNSSSSLSSSSKGKKNSKGFMIQGLGSSGKKPDKDVAKDMGGLNGNNGSTHNSTIPSAGATQNVEQTEGGVAEVAKENKKSSKPGFFERLSKIRLSSGSKNKKQKVHPKTDEIYQDGDSSGTPPVTNTIGGAVSRPLRSANSVNLNGSGNTSSKHGNNNSGANNNSASSSQIANNHGPSSSSSSMQPILKKSATASSSSSTIPSGVGPHYTNSNEMGMVGDSENEPDEATQAFENILEEIAGLKSIQLRQEKSSSSSIDKSPTSQQVRSFAKRKQFYSTNTNASVSSPSPPVSPQNSSRSYSDLDSKLSQFKEDASRTLDTISKSHPDLEIIEDAVKQRQKSLSPEPTMHDVEPTRRPGVSTLPKTFSVSTKSPSYAATEAAQNSEREWYRLLKSATEKFSYPKGPKDEHLYNRDNTNAMLPHKTGIVETDLDTGASREMLDEDMLQLDCKVPCYTVSTSEIPTTAAAASTTSASIVNSAGSPGTAAKTRSLTNLSTRLPLSIAPSSQFEESTGDLSDSEERAKSLEFLLDDNHKSSSVPPENKLRLETRQLSEHELRIQRSLQRLNVPEWYKQHETLSTATNAPVPVGTQSKSGTLSILKRSEYGSSSGLAGGWSGLSTYKAPSMSSLQSNGGRSSGTLNKNFVRGRPATMSVTRTSKESLLASGSASHSPSAFERSSFTYGMPFTMTRFGQGRLSTHSSSVSPPSTPDSTTKTSSYVKKPYLGWRSQEKLNAAAAAGGGGVAPASSNTGPPKLSVYLPPAERLAADLLATRAKSPHPPVRPPISDRPPLPKAPPRSDKTVLSKDPIDKSHDAPAARASSPVISKQTSSLAVVTKLPQSQQGNFVPPPEFSQGKNDGIQSQSRSKLQSVRGTPDVHDSIRQVTNAISNYIGRGNETQTQPKPVKAKTGKKQAIWIESSFVGQKPPTN